MRDEKGKFKKGSKAPRERVQKQIESNKGNQNARKLTTDELKQEAYRQYCAHLAKGKCQESFYFEHPELTITYKTINKYIKEFPSEFPSIQREMADTKSFGVWEQRIEQMVDGQKKSETALIQMVMRNKFGWDKQTEVSHTFEPEARRLLDKWEKSE